MENFYSHSPDTTLPSLSETPIFMILNKSFHPQQENNNSDPTSKNEIKLYQKDFLAQIQKLYWFTYRKDFPLLGGFYSSDVGWGCMLRSAQMLLCQTFLHHFSIVNQRDLTLEEERKILKYFSDSPKEFLSIHSISQSGIRFGKKIGEWFGPSTVSQVIGEIMNQGVINGLVTYVSNDATLYRDEIAHLCQTSSSKWKSLLILIHLRLGLDKINPVYVNSIKQIFRIPQSVGILGGRPRAAYYFVAYQDDYLFYLDPHIIQSSISMEEDFSTESFHSPSAQKMSIDSLDPSIALGFYCHDQKDFENLCDCVQKQSQIEDFSPLFYIEETSPDYRQERKKETKDLEEGFVIIENS